MDRLTQHFVSTEKHIFSNYKTTVYLRNLYFTTSVLAYMIFCIITLNFPVSNLVLISLLLGGAILIWLLNRSTKTWTSCYVKSDTLICKHSNSKSHVIPIYCIKEIVTTDLLLFEVTTVHFHLDGKNQKIRFTQKNNSSSFHRYISLRKEQIKKANL